MKSDYTNNNSVVIKNKNVLWYLAATFVYIIECIEKSSDFKTSEVVF